MARPKKFKEPKRLDMVVEKASKEKAFRIAFVRKISVGDLFEQLLEKEEGRNAEVHSDQVPA